MNGPTAAGGCGPITDRLPELALGILGGGDRAEVLAHLDHCGSCLEASADWAATADVLPLLLSEAEPPAGFEARTLERLRSHQTLVPRPSTMRRVLTVAAIAAAVMIATLAAVRVVDARTADSSSSSGSSVSVASVPMVGAKGHEAGHAFMTGGEEQYVFLDVNYGAQSGMYRIEAVDRANQVTPLGTVAIDEGHGAWAGEMPGGAAGEPPAMVRVVGPDGRVFCTARFGPVAA
jgi:Putative zinc-finger